MTTAYGAASRDGQLFQVASRQRDDLCGGRHPEGDLDRRYRQRSAHRQLYRQGLRRAQDHRHDAPQRPDQRLSDPKSKANVLGTELRRDGASLRLHGQTARSRAKATRRPQSRSAMAATNSAYLEQTIENQAGADNAGTQLALYFARKAPTHHHGLSDPGRSGPAEVRADLVRPADLVLEPEYRHPQAVCSTAQVHRPQGSGEGQALVARFSALYDLANPSTAQSNVTALFGTSTELRVVDPGPLPRGLRQSRAALFNPCAIRSMRPAVSPSAWATVSARAAVLASRPHVRRASRRVRPPAPRCAARPR